jgi:hypothetical protein
MRAHVAEHAFRSRSPGLHDLLTDEEQQLLGEVGGALRGLDDLARLVLPGRLVEELRRVPENHREQVVEVVRDAASQPADRLHLLGLPELDAGR